jgi:hypothetical protein
MLELLVYTLPPQASRFVAMTVRRDHQIPARIVRLRSAFPSLMAGRFEPPAVLFVNYGDIMIHRDTLLSSS